MFNGRHRRCQNHNATVLRIPTTAKSYSSTQNCCCVKEKNRKPPHTCPKKPKRKKKMPLCCIRHGYTVFGLRLFGTGSSMGTTGARHGTGQREVSETQADHLISSNRPKEAIEILNSLLDINLTTLMHGTHWTKPISYAKTFPKPWKRLILHWL